MTPAERGRARRERLRAAGSCRDCGAAAYAKRSRCVPCGQRNAACTPAARVLKRIDKAKRKIREAILALEAVGIDEAERHLLGAFAAIKKHELGVK